jgi:hypothetical protein
LLTSGSCARAGAADVLAVRRRRTALAAAAHDPSEFAPARAAGREGGEEGADETETDEHEEDDDEDDEAEAEDTWVLADYSSLNAASPADWCWLLGGGAAALQSFAVPLPALRDLAGALNGSRSGEASGWRPLARAAAAVAAASGRYLLPGADVAFALPYCGPAAAAAAAAASSDDGGDASDARAVCAAVLDGFNGHGEPASQSGASGGGVGGDPPRRGAGWAHGAALVHLASHANGAVERLADRHGRLCCRCSEDRGGECGAPLTPALAALAAFGRGALGPTDARRAAAAAAAGTAASGAASGATAVHLWSALVATARGDATPSNSAAARAAGSVGDDDDAFGSAVVAGTLAINLARRPDRWRQLQRRVAHAYAPPPSREADVAGDGAAAAPAAAAGADAAAALASAALASAAAAAWSPLRLERLEAIDGAALLARTADDRRDGGGHRNGSRADGGGSGDGDGADADAGEDGEDGEDGEGGEGGGLWLSRAAVAAQFRLGLPPRPASLGRVPPPPAVMNPHEDHGWRPAVVGCALSHLRAWRRIAARGRGHPYASYLVGERARELALAASFRVPFFGVDSTPNPSSSFSLFICSAFPVLFLTLFAHRQTRPSPTLFSKGTRVFL